jgi:hypothetical protein
VGHQEGGQKDGEEDKNDDTRGPMWKALEVRCLCDAWKAVSIEPITGANQTSGTYGKRNKTEFTERKIVDLDYVVMFMSQTKKAMLMWCGII